MRFAFVTCVRIGLDCMEEIYRVGGRLELVLTLKDELARDKSGRVYVDDFCGRHAIPTRKVRTINEAEAVEAIRAAQIDWLFIIGWSQIARSEALAAPRLGVIGMHPTLLPEGRGRAAIPWAILKGLRETGVTMFKLDNGVDTGPILAQARLPIAANETATTLYDRVCEAHRGLIAQAWPTLAANQARAMPQDESRASVWPGRKPEDGVIRPEMTVEHVDRLVRATTRPYPGAFWDAAPQGRIRVWGGAPAASAPAAPGAWRLPLADGAYDALDYVLEARPAAGKPV